MLLKLLSYITGIIASITIPKALRKLVFGIFISLYSVEKADLQRELDQYVSFQDFFTRKVKNRPISESLLVSPVDATIVEFGTIHSSKTELKEAKSSETRLKVKNFNYYLDELLCSSELADDFRSGSYLTLYLSPKDYHRIHSPVDAKITSWVGKAGKLKTVNPKFSNNKILSTNERIVSLIEHKELGKIALVKVGALNVGSIYLNYLDLELGNHLFKDPYPKQISKTNFEIKKGQEIARFNLGSTVVLCFEKNIIDLDSLSIGKSLKMGQGISLVK